MGDAVPPMPDPALADLLTPGESEGMTTAEQHAIREAGLRDAALATVNDQRTLDYQTLAYTLQKTREEMAITTVNWHIAKIVPMEELLPNGQKRKVHPASLAKRIRELLDQEALLLEHLTTDDDLPRPGERDTFDVVRPELEVASSLPDGIG